MENYGLDGGRVMVMVMEELERGRDLATQLRRVLVNSAEGTPACAKDLAEKVVTSFSNTLLLLKNDQSYSPKSDDSADSCKSTTSAFTKRRPSYKRRRTSQTSEIESEAPIDDGHAWRKYGQKNIMNATYPRNYFRCSHKFEQGCQATKQVQRIQEKPALYRTTYCGTHTCNRTSLGNHIVLDAANSPSHDDDASIFISFDHNLPSHQPFFSSSPSLPFTQTLCKQEIPSSSSEDYVLSPPSHVSDIFYDDLQLDHFDF